MSDYLKDISGATNVNISSSSEDLTHSEIPIVEINYSNEITRGDKELVEIAEEVSKPEENICTAKSVIVRKYQLYKSRGE